MKYWNDDDDVVLNDQERMDVIVALETAEKRPKPSVKVRTNVCIDMCIYIYKFIVIE
jgi:hypothetical protein